MYTRLLKVNAQRALLTYQHNLSISMLCSQFNRCLLLAQHHSMPLKGTTGVSVHKTDQSFFKTTFETEAVGWQQHHWHLTYNTVNSVTWFPNQNYLIQSSLLSVNCLESLNHQQTPFSPPPHFFFFFPQKKMPKIPLLFLQNTKLSHC